MNLAVCRSVTNVLCCNCLLQESKTSQLLSQLLYDAVAQEKLQILPLQIALHQVCHELPFNFFLRYCHIWKICTFYYV